MRTQHLCCYHSEPKPNDSADAEQRPTPQSYHDVWLGEHFRATPLIGDWRPISPGDSGTGATLYLVRYNASSNGLSLRDTTERELCVATEAAIPHGAQRQRVKDRGLGRHTP